jgi:hypothetical protein
MVWAGLLVCPLQGGLACAPEPGFSSVLVVATFRVRKEIGEANYAADLGLSTESIDGDSTDAEQPHLPTGRRCC